MKKTEGLKKGRKLENNGRGVENNGAQQMPQTITCIVYTVSCPPVTIMYEIRGRPARNIQNKVGPRVPKRNNVYFAFPFIFSETVERRGPWFSTFYVLICFSTRKAAPINNF